jgi:Protein of unknown function (DUF3300)
MQKVNMGQSWISILVKTALSGSIVVALLGVGRNESFAQVTEPASATIERKTLDALQQLVAPIALYPDALVAQILAASTYPNEVVEADRWLQKHSSLKREELAAEVDQQTWDPSVKALTAFPSILSNMDQNLSWTSELGETYFNQQQDVLDAVQTMRRRAEQAGNLQTNTQERVVNDGSSIIIQPAYANVCYLPVYDPWLVYGAPIVPYPGYFYGPWFAAPYVSFGPGVSIGFFGGFGWGWPAWGFNWGNRVLVFNRVPYVPRNSFFFRRGPFIGPIRGFPRGVVSPRIRNGFNRNNHAFVPNRLGGVNSWSYRMAPNAGGVQHRSFERGNFGRSVSGGRRFSGGWHGAGHGRH